MWGDALREDNGSVADEQHAILCPQTDGASKDESLGVLTEFDDLLRGVCVGDPSDVLLDDRTFVKVRGHEVCRCTDELDASGMRLVVRLRAFEPREQ